MYECWQNNSTENIEEDFEDRMKKELTDPENVDDAAMHDTEKPCVEICVNAEKTVQLRILKTLKTEWRRK